MLFRNKPENVSEKCTYAEKKEPLISKGNLSSLFVNLSKHAKQINFFITPFKHRRVLYLDLVPSVTKLPRLLQNYRKTNSETEVNPFIHKVEKVSNF